MATCTCTSPSNKSQHRTERTNGLSFVPVNREDVTDLEDDLDAADDALISVVALLSLIMTALFIALIATVSGVTAAAVGRTCTCIHVHVDVEMTLWD